jgi:hypothetical protein
MQPTVLHLQQPVDWWLRTLHCFYAGLFALVLPLICWGAQAMPGHPHARAHFVFLPPPLAANVALTVSNPAALASVIDHTAHQSADHAAHRAVEQTEQPVGRSVPAMLGFSLLLLIGLASTYLPRTGDQPTFDGWVMSPSALSVSPSIPTPPPR